MLYSQTKIERNFKNRNVQLLKTLLYLAILYEDIFSLNEKGGTEDMVVGNKM